MNKNVAKTKTARAIFLDRDGTINIDHGFVYRVDDFQFAPQAPESMRLLQDGGYKLIVITNQSGIGHGKYTEKDMHVLHQHMQDQLDGFGVKLDGIAFCPHRRDAACTCRKPGIGMLEQVSDVIADVDFTQSWMVGDKEADVLFGQTAGMQTALLSSRYWQRDTLVVEPTVFAPSLYDFAKQLTSNSLEL